MREQLQRVSGQSGEFTAMVGRSGTVTFLLEDLRLASDGSPAADHVWCKDGKWSSRLRLGDRVRFEARVVRYLKGYRGDDPLRQSASPVVVDYKLEQPRKVIVVDHAVGNGG